jgi:hypothetical protein
MINAEPKGDPGLADLTQDLAIIAMTEFVRDLKMKPPGRGALA